MDIKTKEAGTALAPERTDAPTKLLVPANNGSPCALLARRRGEEGSTVVAGFSPRPRLRLRIRKYLGA